MAFINNCITNAGRTAIGRACKEEPLEFTKIVMGDGTFDPSKNIREMEEVISPKATVPISKLELVPPDTAKVGGSFVNNTEGDGFWWRELALYARMKDTNEPEFLFAYGNSGEFAEFIPPSGAATSVTKNIDILTKVDEGSNVTFYVSASAYATVEQYEAYRALAQEAKDVAEEALGIAEDARFYARNAYTEARAVRSLYEALNGKVGTLWDAVMTSITTNPWLASFGSLEDIELVSGTWNQPLARIEC